MLLLIIAADAIFNIIVRHSCSMQYVRYFYCDKKGRVHRTISRLCAEEFEIEDDASGLLKIMS